MRSMENWTNYVQKTKKKGVQNLYIEFWVFTSRRKEHEYVSKTQKQQWKKVLGKLYFYVGSKQ